MYSPIVMATHQRSQMTNMNIPVVPPEFAPIQPIFGENHFMSFHGQHESLMNPSYQEHVSYPKYQIPSPNFSFQQGQMMNNAQFYPEGFRYQYSVQVWTDHLERNVATNGLVVELERSSFPLKKPRLNWTPELHERFNHAAQELGGYFKATPKAILQKMNVRGITNDQIKSHLQKVRNRVLNTSSTSKISNDETYGTSNFDSNIGEHEDLHKSSETQNDLRIAPTKEGYAASNF